MNIVINDPLDIYFFFVIVLYQQRFLLYGWCSIWWSVALIRGYSFFNLSFWRFWLMQTMLSMPFGMSFSFCAISCVKTFFFTSFLDARLLFGQATVPLHYQAFLVVRFRTYCSTRRCTVGHFMMWLYVIRRLLFDVKRAYAVSGVCYLIIY